MTLKTAKAHAAFEGRKEISERDIALAAELALPHRIKRGPFHQAEMSMEDLQERIEQLQGATPKSERNKTCSRRRRSQRKKKMG